MRDGSGGRWSATAPLGEKLIVPIKTLRLWSPETPFLYTMTVTLKLGNRTMDQVESYVGMRKISLGKDAKGFTRLMLNNQSLFSIWASRPGLLAGRHLHRARPTRPCGLISI